MHNLIFQFQNTFLNRLYIAFLYPQRTTQKPNPKNLTVTSQHQIPAFIPQKISSPANSTTTFEIHVYLLHQKSIYCTSQHLSRKIIHLQDTSNMFLFVPNPLIPERSYYGNRHCGRPSSSMEDILYIAQKNAIIPLDIPEEGLYMDGARCNICIGPVFLIVVALCNRGCSFWAFMIY